jgi:D-alanyl-D-alanine carboxypeptidase (penicillin-binding protein 5/6)
MLIKFKTFFGRLIIFLVFYLCAHSAFAAEIESDYKELSKANFFLLIDQDTKEVLAEKNADFKVAPSSMTKLMTSYVIFDQVKKGKLKLNNQCLIGKAAWRKSGSKMFLKYGDIVTIDQLLGGLLVVSGNDAAVALAEITSGSINNFAELMNKTAKKIGLQNSHFKNPHGLNEDGHYMSLRDLAILSSRISADFPEYMHYFSTPAFTYGPITQSNRNPLIAKGYEGVTGMKTGYTNQGGYGMVGTVNRGNRKLIAVVNEAKTPKQREKIITELLDYGYNDYKKVTFFDKGRTIAKINTWLGNKDQLEVVSNQDIAVTLPKNIPFEKVKVEVQYNNPIYTPIAKGQKVATLVIKIPNKKTKEVPLFAKENIDKAGYFKRIWKVAKYQSYQFFTEVL